VIFVEKAYMGIDLSGIAKSFREHCNNGFDICTDPELLVKDLTGLIDNDSAALFVLRNDIQVVGIMGMTVFKNPFGWEKIGNEHYWFVLPEYRGHSMKLFRAAKKWAKHMGCTFFMCNASNLASDMHDKICLIYEKMGMKKFETSYIKKIG